MWYSLVCDDVEDSLEKRKAARPAHIARLVDLRDQGRLLLAGPNPAVDSNDPGAAGFTGSIVIAEFESLREAKDWADQDPYLKLGVYSKIRVKPFKRVLP